MRHAEEVTFGGSGLERAAQWRGDAARIAGLLAEGWVTPLWRGKPLVGEGEGLGWLPAAHPVFEGAGEAVFLGMDAGRPRFARDISHWMPPAGDPGAAAGFMDASAQGHPALPARLSFRDLRAVMAALSARDAELAVTAKAILQWHQSHGFCAACGAASQMAEAGWQRRCPACGAHHFPRTDPVVIMLIEHGNRLLMGRSPGWPEGMYSLLAGFVEPGETLEAAVRREVEEESGVKVGEVGYLASQPWPFPASLMIGCRGRALTEAITVDPVELEDARWVSREEMVQVMAGAHPVMRAGRKGAVAHFLITNWLADRLD